MKKKLFLIAITALAINATTRADVFPEGYTFTYHFDTLPAIYEPIILTASFMSINVGGVYPITSVMSWEMFEGLPGGTPVASGIWSPDNFHLAGIPYPTWQDAEGSFRISVLSGSQLINSVSIYLPGAPQGYVYELTVVPPPVPEPTTFSLLYIGLAVTALISWHRKRQSVPAI